MANIIQRLFGRKAVTLPNANNDLIMPTAPRSGPNFQFIGGSLVPYRDNKLTYIQKGYGNSDLLYSIIKLIVDKAMQAPGAFYIIEDQEAYKRYKGLHSTIAGAEPGRNTSEAFRELKKLRTKAMTLYQDDEYLQNLIEWPNANECFADHNAALWTYKLAAGDYYEAGWTPWQGGLEAGKPQQLYSLPPQFMTILASNSLPLTAIGYILQVGFNMDFTAEDILHEKYFNPEWDVYGSQLYGMSPVRAGLPRLQRNNEVQKRGAKAANNAGADVIVYVDDENLMKGQQGQAAWKQIGALKDQWEAEQSGPSNAGKAVWSGYKMGVQRLGLTPVELELLESEKVDLRMMCNWYGVPSQLLNDPENKTYANQSEGEKALLTRCAMPLQVSRQRSFTRKLRSLPAYQNVPIVFEFDPTVYTELEANKVDTVTWLRGTYLPIKRQLEILGEDIPESMTEEELSAIPIPAGTTLLSDLFTQPEPPTDPNNTPYDLPTT